jgi:serine/threonine protein kinase
LKIPRLYSAFIPHALFFSLRLNDANFAPHSNSGYPFFHPENHPRIVGIIDGPFNDFPGALEGKDGKEWTMLLEYCEGGDLSRCKNEYLKQSRAVPEMLIWKYFLQIAEALAFLHWGYGTESFDPANPYARDYSFVHRDLKPCNLLRTENRKRYVINYYPS